MKNWIFFIKLVCRLFLKWYFIETKYIFLVNTKYGNFRLCSLLKYACQITSPTQNSINIKLSTIIKREKKWLNLKWKRKCWEIQNEFNLSNLNSRFWGFLTSRSFDFLDETHHDNNELHFYDTQFMRCNLFLS